MTRAENILTVLVLALILTVLFISNGSPTSALIVLIGALLIGGVIGVAGDDRRGK